MERQKLGREGLEASALGLAWMRMSEMLLSDADLVEIARMVAKGVAAGRRYRETLMGVLDG
jgi:aryl-alcohol dehydrogenase-like predicted oxidoreductase